MAEVSTLYEWAGGAEALERLTEVFYQQVHRDPLLAPVFAHVGADHAHHVSAWLSEVFGGPATYTTDHGGYPMMLRHHLGQAITPEQRARWAQLIAEAADEAGLPADPEFRSAFVAYVEWARASRWRTPSWVRRLLLRRLFPAGAGERHRPTRAESTIGNPRTRPAATVGAPGSPRSSRGSGAFEFR